MSDRIDNPWLGSENYPPHGMIDPEDEPVEQWLVPVEVTVYEDAAVSDKIKKAFEHHDLDEIQLQFTVLYGVECRNHEAQEMAEDEVKDILRSAGYKGISVYADDPQEA